MGSCLAKLVIPLGLGGKGELAVLRAQRRRRRTCHPGLVFQHLCFGTAGAKGCEAIGRRGVGWGSAGPCSWGGYGGWNTCRRAAGAGVAVLWGVLFQQMGAGGGTSLGFFQPSSPTALAALSFILGQRLLIFLSWLSSLLLKGLSSVWATSHPQQLREQALRAAGGRCCRA